MYFFIFCLEKGAGVKKNSGASTLPSKQLSSSGLQQPSKLTAKPTNNKIDRQPSNASSKQEANRYGHKTSRYGIQYFLNYFLYFEQKCYSLDDFSQTLCIKYCISTYD